MRRALSVFPIVALVLLAVGCSQAAKYPDKPISMTIPFAAGGTTDAVGRTLADRLKTHLGQPVVVVNKSSVPVGLGELMQAKPDGYTIAFVNDNYLTVSPHISDLPWKGSTDFSILAPVNSQPVAIAVSPDSPWKSMKELIEASKANPGKIRVASSAIGSVNHVDFAMLAEMTNAQMTYVPFGGGAQATATFLGGHAEAFIAASFEMKPHVESGRARVLGVFSDKRSPALPDVPTLKEQGYDVQYMTNGIVIGPKGLPENVKSTLEGAIKKVTDDPEFVKAIEAIGPEVAHGSSKDVMDRLVKEEKDGKALVERLGLKQK